MRVALIVASVSLAVAGCATNAAPPSSVRSPVIGTPIPATASADYRIGPLDTLSITVFQVPDLTLKEARVDASGQLALPLIGSVTAAGKTTSELSGEIAGKLRAGFLQSPQVSVIVNDSVSQKVTVDGAVAEPGVFELKGRTTLMQAVAMARGPSKDANLKHVAVFRNVGDQRTVAVFDLASIRAGRAADPDIYGSDVVVVESSALKGVFREILSAIPALAIFRPY